MDEETIISDQRRAYRDNFLVHGDSPLGTYQNNQVTQHLRFEAILDPIAPFLTPGTTIHDIGAGLCDFYPFLQARAPEAGVIYSGTEIVQEMIDLARAKFPDLTLLNRNFLGPAVVDRHDFIILSGTLNLLGDTSEADWRAMSMALIERMFRQADKGIVLNFLTSYRTFSDPTLCYFDPREMLDFAMTRLSRFASVQSTYPLYECTMTVFKPDFLATVYDHPDLAKYFR